MGEFNEDHFKGNLSSAISNVKSSGSFASFDKLGGHVDANLVVAGVGHVSLPLTESGAAAVIAKCHQAPFGKGEHTIVDTTVRKMWELGPEQFELQNPSWPSFISRTAARAVNELGISGEAIRGAKISLYKLLLYEEGAIFKPHQDSEKEPGMFGTLVICLPSAHEGGWLKLSHGNETKTFRTDCIDSSYACWYSDVIHEVTEIRKGHRLVLTYNLITEPGARRPMPKNPSADLASLRESLHTWAEAFPSNAPDVGSCYLHTLNHKYTEQGLAMHMLKGTDFDIVRLLTDAADACGIACFLAQAEKMVSGSCDDPGYDDGWGHGRYGRGSSQYGWGGRSRYDAEDDDDDEDEDGYDGSGGHHIISDVFDHSLSLKKVVDLDGRHVGTDIDIIEDNFLRFPTRKDRSPDEEDYEGYTGNAGASATYWYRDTVLILVPKSVVVDVLFLEPSTNQATAYSRAYATKASSDAACGLLDYCYLQYVSNEEESAEFQLVQVCQTILSALTKYDAEAVLQATKYTAVTRSISALQVALSQPKYLTSPTVTLLSQWITEMPPDEFVAHSDRPLMSISSLHARFEVVQTMKTAISNDSPDGTQHGAAKILWLDQELESLLSTISSLQASDAEPTLAIITQSASVDQTCESLNGTLARLHWPTLFTTKFLSKIAESHVTNEACNSAIQSIFEKTFAIFRHNLDLPEPDTKREQAFPQERRRGPFLYHLRPELTVSPDSEEHWTPWRDCAQQLYVVLVHARTLQLNPDIECLLANQTSPRLPIDAMS